jgi:hypothetical protein
VTVTGATRVPPAPVAVRKYVVDVVGVTVIDPVSGCRPNPDQGRRLSRRRPAIRAFTVPPGRLPVGVAVSRDWLVQFFGSQNTSPL